MAPDATSPGPAASRSPSPGLGLGWLTGRRKSADSSHSQATASLPSLDDRSNNNSSSSTECAASSLKPPAETSAPARRSSLPRPLSMSLQKRQSRSLSIMIDELVSMSSSTNSGSPTSSAMSLSESEVPETPSPIPVDHHHHHELPSAASLAAPSFSASLGSMRHKAPSPLGAVPPRSREELQPPKPLSKSLSSPTPSAVPLRFKFLQRSQKNLASEAQQAADNEEEELATLAREHPEVLDDLHIRRTTIGFVYYKTEVGWRTVTAQDLPPPLDLVHLLGAYALPIPEIREPATDDGRAAEVAVAEATQA